MPRAMDYRDIADDLAARITAGEYPAGSKLPSYGEMAKLYSVSVSTMTRAVSLLRDRRLVYGSPGRGVYVQGPEE